MTATRNSARFGIGENAPRAAKIAALSLGVALFASACGGNPTPEEEGGASSAPAASGLTCPESQGGAAPEPGEKGDPAAVPEAETTSDSPLVLGSLLPTTGALAFLGPPEIAGVNLAVQEINEAGGVLGQDVEIIHRDSGDTT
ncbi:MAG: ABC transporter substrate-binding protein, partial [Actinomycetes bacterium]